MMFHILTAVALAGVFVNGVPVDPSTLSETIPDADVLFDGKGNVFVIAPTYQIPAGGLTAPPAPTVHSSVTMGTNPRGVPDNGVPRARYWLATEDNGSSGHEVEVTVNGRLAVTVRSGEPAQIRDLASFLQIGSNVIDLRSVSSNPAGGTFYVFVGLGRDEHGTVHIDTPIVQYGVGPGRQGSYSRQYSLQVSP